MPHSLVEGFRLSPPQRHLWLRQGEHVGPYRVCAEVSVGGPLDRVPVEAGIGALTERHEILRTTYRLVPGMKLPVQVVEPDGKCSIEVEDLRAFDPAAQARAIDAAFHTLAGIPVDIDRGPVWHARLLTRSATESTLLLMWPSLVADAASVAIVVRELARLSAGAPADAADDLPLQHVDVAEWQHDLLESDGTAAGREFWRQIDRDALMACRLPLRRRQRPGAPFTPRRIATALPADVVARMPAWAAAHDSSAQDVLLAAWQLLMWRLTERADLTVGIGSDGRPLDDLDRVVGPLARILPVRCRIDDRWSFAELVERSRAARLDRVRWQSMFAWQTLGGNIDADAEPFCPLVFDAFEAATMASADRTTWRIDRVDACGDRVELKTAVARTTRGWNLSCTYDEHVHTADQVACVADQYVSALRAALDATGPVLADIDIRGEWERAHARSVPVAFAGDANADVAARGFRPIHRLFEEHAAAAPDREAVVCGAERLTYGELNVRADRIACFLRAQGVAPETRVGLFLERSCDLLAAVLGVLKAGGAFVPLSPEQPIGRLASFVERVAAPLVITHRHLGAAWPATSQTRVLRLDEDAEAIAAASPVAAALPFEPASLAYVMFTSGSTGEPKGVMIPHGALAHYVVWSEAAYLPARDVSILLHSSIGFDATLTSLLVPLCAGARMIVAPESEGLDAIARIATSPDRHGFLKVTPAHLGVVAARVAEDRLAPLSGTLVIGGEALNGEQLAAWQAHAPATRVVNEYGPTEATVGCIVHQVLAGDVEPGPVPIGHPIADTVCHALDSNGRPAAVGVTGELYIGGAQIARGYEGRPDLTAERFLPDPFAPEPGARCYRTGDLVRPGPGGAFEYVGRRDHQVKVRGYRVELGEIEAALRQQPNVRDAVVVLREDAPGDRRLVGYVVASPGSAAASDQLQQALRAALPDYMVPAIIVSLDDLPVTTNGKVDRRRLPVPDASRPRLAQAYVAPRTDAEAALARIWAEVLRLDRVGVHDNFFALGGDSILSLQIVARAARAGLRLAPRLVFEHQTVEALAAVAQQSTAAPVDQAPVTGVVPLTPVQRWFFDQPIQDRDHYNQALALDLLQPVPAAVLTDAWLRLQIHHDALRLRYRRGDAGWEQINADVDQVSAPTIVDASLVAAADRAAAWARIARACQRSLNLEHGPLARAALVEWGPAAPSRLLIVQHHVICDGLSWRVLLEDFQELCRRDAVQAGALDLPPKTISVKRWAEKLVEVVNGGGFDAELPQWTATSEPGASIPHDRGAAPNDVASQRTEAITFSAEQTEALVHRLPASLDVHVQDVLLTGLLTALARWSGERTWRIDLEGHGRELLGGDDDVSRTVGWFTSVYPVRLTAPEDDDPVAVLRAVRAAVRRVPRYGVGYGALRYLRDDTTAAPLRHADAPEIIFNYWGQLDQVFAASRSIRPAATPVGPSRSPRQLRSHVFEISASVVEARLQVAWTYSVNLHEPQTIERLASELRDAVCRLSALPDDTRASLKTPADFPLADLTQPELDRIVADGGPVADAYPLSPLQEGLLFHRLYDTDDGAIYTQQFAARLVGPLDPPAFQQAWEATVARHDILRTAFLWERRERPLQIVRERAPLPWTLEDWRGLAPAEQDARLAERLEADRRRGFSVEHAPLMRVGLIRLADDQWHVLWTSHHLVLDGWSMPIVVRDVLTAYAAQRQHLAVWTEPPAARYADYIAWLQRQDDARAEAFWRRALDGIKAPTFVAAPHAAARATAASRRDVLRAELPASLVEALQRLGGMHGITMNSWFAGTWALLLAHCTRHQDVLFGAVVSGRPADLPGVETIAGMFVNMLPFRATVAPRAPLLTWFAECQRSQLETRDHEYMSLARIQSWSPLPKGMPLFDTIFVFENYPVDYAWRQQTEFRVEQASAIAPTSYPVEVEVAGASPGLVVSVAVDPERIGSAVARFLADGFEAMLSRLVAAPDDTVGALLEHLDELTLRPDATRSRQLQSVRQASLRALRHAAPEFTS